MWLYRAYSGSLYHGGEVQANLPSFTQGDIITCQLEFGNDGERTLSFAKNCGPMLVAFRHDSFRNIPSGAELFPAVVFYSQVS